MSTAAKFAALYRHLVERQGRWTKGAEPRSLGYGGAAVAARAAGVGRVTVTGGVRESEAGDELLGRTRRVGGCRKRVVTSETEAGLRGENFGHAAEDHLSTGQPVISVDGKKMELVGSYRNGGQEY